MRQGTQNESLRKRGGQRGNANAKKHSAWRFNDLDLMTADSCIRFLVELVKATWTGEIGTRQAGCINNSVRTILTYYLNASHVITEPEYVSGPVTPPGVGVRVVENRSAIELMKIGDEMDK